MQPTPESSKPSETFSAEELDSLVADLKWNVDNGNLRPTPDPKPSRKSAEEDREQEQAKDDP